MSSLTSRVFNNGNSQAVRILPLACRLPLAADCRWSLIAARTTDLHGAPERPRTLSGDG